MRSDRFSTPLRGGGEKKGGVSSSLAHKYLVVLEEEQWLAQGGAAQLINARRNAAVAALTYVWNRGETGWLITRLYERRGIISPFSHFLPLPPSAEHPLIMCRGMC